MKSFNKRNLPGLRDDIDAALKVVAEKHNISLNAGNCSFMEQTATFKLEMSVNGENGQAVDKYAIALQDRYPDLVGKDVSCRGLPAKVVGFNSRAHKYPFITEAANGNRYRVTRGNVGLPF